MVKRYWNRKSISIYPCDRWCHKQHGTLSRLVPHRLRLSWLQGTERGERHYVFLYKQSDDKSILLISSYLPAYSDAYLILDIVRLGIEMTCSRSSFRIGCRAMTSTMHFVDPGCSQYMCVHAVLDLLVPEVGDFPIKFDFLLWWLAWGHLRCCALLLVRSLVQASIIGLPDKVTRGLDFSHFGNLAFLPQG